MTELALEIETVNTALQQLQAFLDDAHVRDIGFKPTSGLCSVMATCQRLLEYLCRKFRTVHMPAGHGCTVSVGERLKWPLQKQQCSAAAERLHRCSQAFLFSLTISNWQVNLHFPVNLLSELVGVKGMEWNDLLSRSWRPTLYLITILT